MSIKPPSDIVLDVAKAADPMTALAATRKLTQVAGFDRAEPEDFSSVYMSDSGESAQQRVVSGVNNMLGSNGGAPAGIKVDGDPRTKAFKGLEQLVLKQLVETMLPKDAVEMFGHGTAGDVWRSMLADQLATQIGKTVDLGLSKQSVGGPNGNPRNGRSRG